MRSCLTSHLQLLGCLFVPPTVWSRLASRLKILGCLLVPLAVWPRLASRLKIILGCLLVPLAVWPRLASRLKILGCLLVPLAVWSCLASHYQSIGKLLCFCSMFFRCCVSCQGWCNCCSNPALNIVVQLTDDGKTGTLLNDRDISRSQLAQSVPNVGHIYVGP
jgi:hypothetical protein